jgi:membrane-bound lytic murein transglycosylase B
MQFTAKKAWRLAISLTLAWAFMGSVPAQGHRVRHHHRHWHRQPVAVDPQDVKFAQFVKDFRVTAIAAGIRPSLYDWAMGGTRRNERVEALTQVQPEFVKPVWSYLDSSASPRRVSDGQQKLIEQSAILASVAAKYGVPREILVSIWGNETDYGRQTGGFNIFEALATLAYDGSRSDFGRRELLAALRIVQQERLDPKQLPSSWAGAFGQLQMIPSTFLKSAIDGDGDGRRDLWHSTADAFASAAAELAADGWQPGQSWGFEVRLPANFPYEIADGESLKSIDDWSLLGVRAFDGTALRPSADLGAVYLPAGRRGPAFVTLANFRVILKYNNAASYALAVCTLADLITGRPGIVAGWPREEEPMSRDERYAFQNALVKLGFDPGKIDGILGRGVRAALRQYQKTHGMPADGFPTLGLLTSMLIEARQRGL